MPGTRFAGGPAESPGFLLWHVTLRWQRALTSVLAPLDLTHVQFVLLACTWWLGERGEAPNQVAVAAQAGTEVRMTSEVLRRLERRGLVERPAAGGDARAKLVRVTPAGARLATEAVAVVEAADAAFFAAAPPAFLAALPALAR